ncbi:MAG: glycosyltransferase family 2 protein [Rhodospirillales bacterium]
MSVHNGAETLARALRSTLADMGETDELIVMDDASDDATRDILAGWDDRRLFTFRNDRRLGLTASLNRAFAKSSGAFIGRMDADDETLPGRFENQIGRLQASGADISLGSYWLVGADGNETLWEPPHWALIRWRSLSFNRFGAHPSAVMTRAAFEQLGGYDESFPLAQDYDLWDRALAAGLNFRHSKAPLIRYHLGPQALGAKRQDEQRDAATRVSDRALKRTFPDIRAEEAAALRWLAGAVDTKPNAEDMSRMVRQLPDRIQAFSAQLPDPVPARRLIWQDVSDRVWRRRRDIPDTLTQRLFKQATLQGGSIKALWRGLRAGQNRSKA